jgi:hypothetical protein
MTQDHAKHFIRHFGHKAHFDRLPFLIFNSFRRSCDAQSLKVIIFYQCPPQRRRTGGVRLHQWRLEEGWMGRQDSWPIVAVGRATSHSTCPAPIATIAMGDSSAQHQDR